MGNNGRVLSRKYCKHFSLRPASKTATASLPAAPYLKLAITSSAFRAMSGTRAAGAG